MVRAQILCTVMTTLVMARSPAWVAMAGLIILTSCWLPTLAQPSDAASACGNVLSNGIYNTISTSNYGLTYSQFS
jgi:hypothetical protein